MSRRSKQIIRIGLSVVVGVAVLVVMLYGFQMYRGWTSIGRVNVDTQSARDALAATGSSQGDPAASATVPPTTAAPAIVTSSTTEPAGTAPYPPPGTAAATTTTSTSVAPDTTTTIPPPSTLPPPPVDDDGTRVFLIIGNDSRPSHAGNRADVIMLAILKDGQSPVLTSLPRDLYINNPCKGYDARINTNLGGCSDPSINGPTLLTIAVEDFTGIKVDHFIIVGWEGFTRIIDAVGGIEICTDETIRDTWSGLYLDPGCTHADGDLAFAWVRSRKTQHLSNGEWVHLPGASDLSRNAHQQELMVQLLGKVKNFSSPFELLAFASSLSDAFIISDDISLSDMASLAWDYRHVDPASVVRFEIPVKPYTTSRGASVLLPTTTFREAYDDAVTAAREEYLSTTTTIPDNVH